MLNLTQIEGTMSHPMTLRHTLLILKVIYRAGKTPQGPSSLIKKANYQTAKKLPSIINQVQLLLMVQKSFELSTPIHLTG